MQWLHLHKAMTVASGSTDAGAPRPCRLLILGRPAILQLANFRVANSGSSHSSGITCEIRKAVGGEGC